MPSRSNNGHLRNRQGYPNRLTSAKTKLLLVQGTANQRNANALVTAYRCQVVFETGVRRYFVEAEFMDYGPL